MYRGVRGINMGKNLGLPFNRHPDQIKPFNFSEMGHL